VASSRDDAAAHRRERVPLQKRIESAERVWWALNRFTSSDGDAVEIMKVGPRHQVAQARALKRLARASARRSAGASQRPRSRRPAREDTDPAKSLLGDASVRHVCRRVSSEPPTRWLRMQPLQTGDCRSRARPSRSRRCDAQHSLRRCARKRLRARAGNLMAWADLHDLDCVAVGAREPVHAHHHPLADSILSAAGTRLSASAAASIPTRCTPPRLRPHPCRHDRERLPSTRSGEALDVVRAAQGIGYQRKGGLIADHLLRPQGHLGSALRGRPRASSYAFVGATECLRRTALIAPRSAHGHCHGCELSG